MTDDDFNPSSDAPRPARSAGYPSDSSDLDLQFNADRRKRWSAIHSVLLAIITGTPVVWFYLVGGFIGKGSEVASLIALVILLIAMFISMMAGESLSWRLSRRGQWVALTVLGVVAVVVLVSAWALWRDRHALCERPNGVMLRICWPR